MVFNKSFVLETSRFAKPDAVLHPLRRTYECSSQSAVYEPTRVKLRYGLALRILLSFLHSFLKGVGLPANSCFALLKNAEAQTCFNSGGAKIFVLQSREAQTYGRISSDKTKQKTNFARLSVTEFNSRRLLLDDTPILSDLKLQDLC